MWKMRNPSDYIRDIEIIMPGSWDEWIVRLVVDLSAIRMAAGTCSRGILDEVRSRLGTQASVEFRERLESIALWCDLSMQSAYEWLGGKKSMSMLMELKWHLMELTERMVYPIQIPVDTEGGIFEVRPGDVVMAYAQGVLFELDSGPFVRLLAGIRNATGSIVRP